MRSIIYALSLKHYNIIRMATLALVVHTVLYCNIFTLLYDVLYRHVTLAFYRLSGHLLVQTVPWCPG